MLFSVYYLVQQAKTLKLRVQNNLIDQTAAKIMGFTSDGQLQ